MNNPYTSRGPLQAPGMFHGRAHELDEIGCFVQGNQSVSIVGPRKIGKSSLLLKLMEAEPGLCPGNGKSTLLTYLDCQALSGESRADIIVQFCTGIAEALRSYELEPEPALKAAASNPAWPAFEAAVRSLNRRGLRIGLMLDEIELLTRNPHVDVNFYNALRSLAGRLQLVFLTASARPLIELTYSERPEKILSSPFFNIFAQVFLGLLPESEARSLIHAPMQAAGRTVFPELEDFIYELAGGHPLALQIACFHAWDNHADLKLIENQTLQDLDSHFQYYWHNLSPVEREVLRDPDQAAAQQDGDPALRLAFRNLVRSCLLVQEHGSYVYPSRAWAEFVLARPQEHEASQPEELPRESAPVHMALPEGDLHKAGGTQDLPPPIMRPVKSKVGQVMRESLPEMIGAISSAIILAIAGLIYTQFPSLLDKLAGTDDAFARPWLLPGALIILAIGTFAALRAWKRNRNGAAKK